MLNFFHFVASLGLGALGAWTISSWGHLLGILDKPNHRSSHVGVVPKGGGIGLLAAFLSSAWLLKMPILFWGCAGLVSLISFYGDRKEVPARIRLCVQFAAAFVMVLALFRWETRAWSAYLLIPVFSIFVVGTANYYNFMDGINGIAGITGIVGFVLIAFFAYMSGANQAYWVLGLCMSFACVGFLPFNIAKARVFMGDVGSVLLGLIFASMVVGLTRDLNDFVVLSAFMFPFYADELTTTYIRLKGREDLFQPHRSHIYQLLANEISIPHWKISVSYGFLQAVVGFGALVLRGYGTFVVLGYLGICFIIFWVFAVRLRSVIEIPTEKNASENCLKSWRGILKKSNRKYGKKIFSQCREGNIRHK